MIGNFLYPSKINSFLEQQKLFYPDKQLSKYKNPKLKSNLIYTMFGSKKKSSVRNTLVGQSVNNSAVRKVGQPVQKPLFIKK